MVRLILLYVLAAFAGAALSADNETTHYIQLQLPPPLNWVPDTLALPGASTIETLYKPYNSTNATGWAAYVLGEAERYGGGACVSYSELTTGAYNTEQPYRVWFGIVYGPGANLQLSDFRRDLSQNSQIEDTEVFVTRTAQSSATGTPVSSTASSIVSTQSAPTTTSTGGGGSASVMSGSSTSAPSSTSTGQGQNLLPRGFLSSGLGLLMFAFVM